MTDLTPADPRAVEEAQKARDKEYGLYVATEVIYVGGARAFNPGDPVPTSHVERGVVEETAVARQNTKAAKAVVEKEN